VELSFANSLIQAPQFLTCPYFEIELTLIGQADAKKLSHDTMCLASENFKSEEKLNEIFNNMTEKYADIDGFTFLDPSYVFKFNTDKDSLDGG